MVGFEIKIAIAYLFMLLIMHKMQCSENRQNVIGASLLRKIEIPSRFENVRIDRVAAPYMLNRSPLWRTTGLIMIILKKKIKILKVLIYKKIIKTACTRSLIRYFKKCVRRSRLITKTII